MVSRVSVPVGKSTGVVLFWLGAVVGAAVCRTCVVMFFFFQAEDGIRDLTVTGVQTCALPISTCLDDGQFMSRLDSKQRWGLAIGGILLTLLLAAVFTFGSLNVPFEPKSWRADRKSVV